MNIHGYKLKLRGIKQMLKLEQQKGQEASLAKIKRLKNCKIMCARKIHWLKEARPKIKRAFRKKKRSF